MKARLSRHFCVRANLVSDLSSYQARIHIRPEFTSDIELEQQDVAILDKIVFAFLP